MRQIPNGNFHGILSFHLLDFFPEDTCRTKGDPTQKAWELFGLPFKKSRFPEKIYVRGDKINLSISIPPEISGFFLFFVFCFFFFWGGGGRGAEWLTTPVSVRVSSSSWIPLTTCLSLAFGVTETTNQKCYRNLTN